MELINNAVNGWFRYTSDGKLVVLYLGVLLFMWFGRRKEAGRCEKWLFWYGVISAALALLPVTAIGLMIYNTKFYDYEWIWSVVPLTPVMAYGGTVIFTGCYEKYWKGKILLPACYCAMGLGVLVLCGGMGMPGWDKEQHRQELENAGNVVDYITENGKNIDICLWAPREIMDYAREIDGSIKLLYGRNMWDESLSAYSYDVYEPEVRKLYQWMVSISAGENTRDQAAQACIRTALEYGVNVFILPLAAENDTYDGLTEAVKNRKLEMETGQYGNYNIYRIKSSTP